MKLPKPRVKHEVDFEIVSRCTVFASPEEENVFFVTLRNKKIGSLVLHSYLSVNKCEWQSVLPISLCSFQSSAEKNGQNVFALPSSREESVCYLSSVTYVPNFSFSPSCRLLNVSGNLFFVLFSIFSGKGQKKKYPLPPFRKKRTVY